jgi:hypothetical protein
MRTAAKALRVDDHALKPPTQAYDVPHDVRLVLRDASNTQLAVAACYKRYSGVVGHVGTSRAQPDVTVG